MELLLVDPPWIQPLFLILLSILVDIPFKLLTWIPEALVDLESLPIFMFINVSGMVQKSRNWTSSEFLVFGFVTGVADLSILR